MAVHDFKYRKLVSGGKAWIAQMSDLRSIKSKELHPVLEAFIENISRTSTAAIAPAMIAWKVRRDQLLADSAAFQVTGNLEPDLDKLEATFKSDPKYRQEFERLAKEFFANISPEKYGKILNRYGIEYINILLAESDGMQSTMHALLASVVVESWTAFETLAVDLWYIALDHGPEDWRKRTALKSHKFKGGNSEVPDSLELSKIPDPQKSYGSFLRETEKISFQKLDGIKEWYRATFGKRVQQKLFSADVYIDALAAVRNVITHKAGIADRKYVEAVNSFPELNSAVRDKPILLNGEIVRKLRTSSIVVSRQLLSFVDDQLTYREKP